MAAHSPNPVLPSTSKPTITKTRLTINNGVRCHVPQENKMSFVPESWLEQVPCFLRGLAFSSCPLGLRPMDPGWGNLKTLLNKVFTVNVVCVTGKADMTSQQPPYCVFTAGNNTIWSLSELSKWWFYAVSATLAIFTAKICLVLQAITRLYIEACTVQLP